MNLYIYVENDPLNAIDPEGLIAFLAIPLNAIKWIGVAVIATAGTIKAVNDIANARKDQCKDDRCNKEWDDELISSPAQMAKGGKQTPQNWATEKAKYDAQTLNMDPCDMLDKMLDEAKCEGDNKKIRDIIQAQKFLKCRNVNKRNNQ